MTQNNDCKRRSALCLIVVDFTDIYEQLLNTKVFFGSFYVLFFSLKLVIFFFDRILAQKLLIKCWWYCNRCLHQHFTSNFLYESVLSSFSLTKFCLCNFIGERILMQKLPVKCWLNWQKESTAAKIQLWSELRRITTAGTWTQSSSARSTTSAQQLSVIVQVIQYFGVRGHSCNTWHFFVGPCETG